MRRCAVRTFTVQQRRRAMVHRHYLAGDAGDLVRLRERCWRCMPLTRRRSTCPSWRGAPRSTLTDVADALYQRRSLVRWMAMRRTLFVFSREDIPMVQGAVSTPLAAMLRRAPGPPPATQRD